MQAYPAYTSQRIDDELSVYEIKKFVELWSKPEFIPSNIDLKTISVGLSTVLKGIAGVKD